MRPGTIDTLVTYWNALRAGRPVPRRLEIEPSRIAGILSETFMLEPARGEDYLFRLAGTRLCELLGYELRGTSFLAGWSAPDRQRLQESLAAVCADGAVAHLTFEAGIDSRHRVELRVVLLPLLHGGNNITRVIGAMTPAARPPWLGQGRLPGRRLLRCAVARPGEERPGPSGRTGLTQRPPSGERHHLRLLDGGLSAPKGGKQ